jgi:hypothetical protein
MYQGFGGSTASYVSGKKSKWKKIVKQVVRRIQGLGAIRKLI